MAKSNPLLIVLAALAAGVGCAIFACIPGVTVNDPGCPPENANAAIDVSGVWRYAGENIFLLRGTITFEQQGNQVRVTDTTYDNAGDRALKSEFTPLQGNKLVLVMTPKNGDTNYTANVTLLFSDDGKKFCCEFSDTNGDAGDMGTYTGFKQ